MKGRIVLFVGYFVGVLLVVSWLTGVLQEGVVAKLLGSSDPLRRDSTPAVSGSTELTAGEVEGEAPPLVPGQVERPTASPPQDQAPRDPGRGDLRQSSAQGQPQVGSKGFSERDAVDRALHAKRVEINRLEERLRWQKEQNLIEERGLAEMRASRAKVAKERDARQEAGIMKLAKLYEGMEPEAAASILGSLEKDLATNVLASMKDRQASKVLGAMNGRRARELSERLHEARPNRPNTGESNESGDSARKGTDADR